MRLRPRRFWLRRLHRRSVELALAEGHLLDRAAAGDPGVPARVFAPRARSTALFLLRRGEQLVEHGVLSKEEFEHSAARLQDLHDKAERLGG